MPTGLEYIYTNTNSQYGWSIKGTNKIESNYLMNQGVEPFSYYDAYGNKIYQNTLSYVDLKLECRVSDSLAPYTILTNLAEITKMHILDQNGKMVTNITDKDSTPNNLNVPNDASKPNYIGTAGNWVGMSYYPGQQDDDDFEKVQILYTDITGNVWIDQNQSQTKVQNMLVKLTNLTDGTVSYTRTYGEGQYVFSNILINKQYSIEFEYDGQTYTKSSITWSYANENAADRTALNQRFHEITQEGARNQNNRGEVVTYQYNTVAGTSTVNRTTAPFNKGTMQNGYVVFADMSSESYNPTRMQATTTNLAGDSTLYYNDINFALQERAQTNLEIYSDLANVITTIKGQDHTYSYAVRNLNSRNKDNSYLNTSYLQELYSSDYAYRQELYSNQNETLININELEIYATYYMKIYNNSQTPIRITQLVNYYDQEYESIIASAYSYGDQNGAVSWNTNSKYQNAAGYRDCKVVYTTSLEGIELAPWQEMYVLIRYKVGKDANRSNLLGDKEVATEIYSYTSEEGLIDTSSRPGNVSNREKDSDIAPILRLRTSNKTRQTSGFIWEETVNAVANGVKTGDGLYLENEPKLDQINVQLIEEVTTQSGEVKEYLLAQMNSGEDSQMYINNSGGISSREVESEQGAYEFYDILPGNYIIRFTYGENSVSIQYNGQDYKSTLVRGINTANASDATDNKERRKQVLEIATTMNNRIAEILGNPLLDIETFSQMTAMFSDTNVLPFNIEYDNSQTDHIDFGLVRRPQTKLEITKEIQDVKVINQGIALVDTANGIQGGLVKIKDTNKSDIYKTFHIYLDEELIHGSELTITYKITVRNTGEVDNLANYFEYDPQYGTREEQNMPFTTSADLVYDYTDSLAFEKEKNPEWEETTNYSILKESVADYLRSSEVKTLTTDALNKPLSPGEEVSVDLELTRVMGSNSQDELVYMNEVEIVQRSNEASRRDEGAIPGNYIPADGRQQEYDTWDTSVIFTAPTGQTRIYYLLGFSILGILGCGILLIKKYVLER